MGKLQVKALQVFPLSLVDEGICSSNMGGAMREYLVHSVEGQKSVAPSW